METRRRSKRRQEDLAQQDGQSIQEEREQETVRERQPPKKTKQRGKTRPRGGRRIVPTTCTPPVEIGEPSQPPIPNPPASEQPQEVQQQVQPTPVTQPAQVLQQNATVPAQQFSLHPSNHQWTGNMAPWSAPWLPPPPPWAPAPYPGTWPWTYQTNSMVPQRHTPPSASVSSAPTTATQTTGTEGPSPLSTSCEFSTTTTRPATTGRREGSTPPASSTSQTATSSTNQGPSPGLLNTNGEFCINTDYTCTSPLVSICDDLGSNVPLAMKEKIWKGKYVDLLQLLKSNHTSATLKYKAVLDEQEGLVFQSQSGGEIKSPVTWTTAFYIYMTIYLEKHPQKAKEMLKYCEVIRQASRDYQGLGWRDYDKEFRMRMEQQPTKTWSQIDGELWLMVLSKPQSTLVPQSRNGHMKQGPRDKPAGTSYSSHTFQSDFRTPPTNSQKSPRQQQPCKFWNHPTWSCSRDPCNYAHRCSKCGSRAHGAGSNKC